MLYLINHYNSSYNFLTGGTAEFPDLSILEPALNYSLSAICGDYEIKGPEFAIHDWPEMATVRKQTIGVKYTGGLYYAVETINALNHVIAEDEEITVTDIETGAPPKDKYIDLSKYDPKEDPTCYKGVTCFL